MALEDELIERIRTEQDPNFRVIGRGDRYSGAIVEDLGGLFEQAVLTGGTRNNTLVVSDSDNRIEVDGVARTVAPWHGRVTLDSAGNTTDEFAEHYVITITLDNEARIEIADSGGGAGVDLLDRLRHQPGRQHRARRDRQRLVPRRHRPGVRRRVDARHVPRRRARRGLHARRRRPGPVRRHRGRDGDRHGRRRRRDGRRHRAADPGHAATARSSSPTACRSPTPRT